MPNEDQAVVVEETPTAPQEEVSTEPQEEVSTEPQEEVSTEPQEDAEERDRRSAYQKRIDQLTREKYEARRQLEEREQRLRELEQRDKPVGDQPEPFPTLTESGYDEQAYQRRIHDWLHGQQQAEQKRQQKQQAQIQEQQQQAQKVAKLQANIATVVQKHPDFWTKINDQSLPPLHEVNEHAYNAVLESDKAGEISYYLASNPNEIYALSGLSQYQTVAKILSIEQRLSRPNTPPPQLPEVPGKLPGKSSVRKDPSKMTMEEYAKYRAEQRRNPKI